MINYSFSIANFEYFLLILVRIASFVYIAPFFGDNAVLLTDVLNPTCICTIS